jgi:hypothetical protein
MTVFNLAPVPSAKLSKFALIVATFGIAVRACFWYIQCTTVSRRPGYIWEDWDQHILKREWFFFLPQ